MKTVDLIFLIFFPFFSCLVSLAFKTNFLISILLFLGLPASYLSLRAQKLVKKTAIFSFIFTLPGMIFDFLATFNKSWYIPQTIFPFRILGIIAVEDYLWGYLLIYGIIMFYEYFLEKGKDRGLGKNIIYLVMLSIISLLVFFIFLSGDFRVFRVPYFYLKSGILLILLPVVTFLTVFPRLFSKFIITGSYFFALSFIFELTALSLKQWTFPGVEFVGWVEIFGLRFPFEEFFFWFVMFAVSALSYYEFFADDKK